jgi:hypothetical protein
MEGKELYSNEDEELNSKSKKEDEDGDDFGLPEIEDSDDKSSDLGDPYPDSWEENKKDDDYSDSSDDYTSSSDFSEDDNAPEYSDQEEEDSSDDEEKSNYYEEKYGQKKNPVGWIIFGLFVLIAIVIGIIWWLNKDPEPVEVKKLPVIQQPIQTVEPEIEEVEPEPEKEIKQPGVYEINEPIGRYHVIVASSIDKDLVHDYGMKLARQGMTCNILAPRGNKKFHRLSVADYDSRDDASIESDRLKSTLGADVWVIRY